jgi:hypothetical protein
MTSILVNLINSELYFLMNNFNFLIRFRVCFLFLRKLTDSSFFQLVEDLDFERDEVDKFFDGNCCFEKRHYVQSLEFYLKIFAKKRLKIP